MEGMPYHIQSPFYVKYGDNVHLGENFLANYNAILQDEAEINIGDNVMLASNAILATSPHTIDEEIRNIRGINEYLFNVQKQALPIRLGNNVWICANVTILSGVTIGDNSIIGAGSVVINDIPPNVFACGRPCRVIQKLDSKDCMEDAFMRGGKTMTEFQRMSSGCYVNTMCKSILMQMIIGYQLVRKLNRVKVTCVDKRSLILKRLFGSVGFSCQVGESLSVEYGKNIHVGNNFTAGDRLVLQDGAPIHFGDNVVIGSDVVITTILHSFSAEQRKVQWISQRFPRKHKGLFIYAKPITLGNHVQIGANATICAGVTIGENAVIDAGSVVTRDIPPNVFASGRPCRVIRKLDSKDCLEDAFIREGRQDDD